MSLDILSKLQEIVNIENILINKPMSECTTFRIGGNADYVVTPTDNSQVSRLIKLLKQYNIPYYVIGNGSNLLVSDDGFRGVIIQLYNKFNKHEYIQEGNKCRVKSQAGLTLGKLGNELAKKGLGGFEFATGIPGTVGGAVAMNAGAYGGEIKDVILLATVVSTKGNTAGEIIELTKDELQLGYRTSVIIKEDYIVLDATFEFEQADSECIMNTINELAQQRREKQPIEYPSAGSTFKRPQGYFAGKLISDAGLKGYRVGGAQVSDKHAGFVINIGGATAKDVIELTDEIRNKVKELYNVELELEVRKLGFDKR